jgi:hypothetical protein
MQEGRMKLLMIMLLGMCLACSGCTTIRPVTLDPPPVPARGTLEPGQRVTAVLHDGREVGGTIIAADENGLTVRPGAFGTPHQVAFADMASLQMREIATGRTVAAVIGSTLVVAAGVLYYLLLQRAQDSD